MVWFVKQIVKGLIVTGLAGLVFSAASMYSFLMFLTLISNYKLPLLHSVLLLLAVELFLAYLNYYFLHVAIDSFTLVHAVKKGVLRGLETCV